MLIDIHNKRINEDQNSNQICFYNENDGLGSSYYGDSKRSTLMFFENGCLRVFDAFKYNHKGKLFEVTRVERPYVRPVGGVEANVPVEEEVQYIRDREVLGCDALSWIQSVFQQAIGNQSMMYTQEGVVTNYNDSLFAPTTFNMNYQDIAFTHSIAYALSDFFNKNLGCGYSKEDIMRDFSSIVAYAEKPWLRSYFPEMMAFEGERMMSIEARYNDEKIPLIHRYKSTDFVDVVSEFAKDKELKLNKRLKKLIYSKVATYTYREEIIEKSAAKFRRKVNVKYKCEDEIERRPKEDCPELYEVIKYRKRVFNEELLDLVWLLVGVFGADYTCNVLEKWSEKTVNFRTIFIRYTSAKHVVEFLKLFSREKALRLIEEELGYRKQKDTLTDVRNHTRLLDDTVNMYNEFSKADSIPKKLRDKYPNGIDISTFKFKTLKELHDKIAKQHNEIKMCANNKEIKYSKEVALLDGMESENIRLELPKDTATVSYWGKSLKHCIASYGERAHKQQIILLSVHVDGNLTYNIEMKMFDKEYLKSPAVQHALPTLEAALANTDYDEEIEGPRAIDNIALKNIQQLIRQFRGLNNCSAKKEYQEIVHKMIASWWIDALTSSLNQDRKKDSKHSDLSQEQLKEQKLDSCSEEEQSEGVPNQASNENPQHRNQDQQSIRGA